MAKKEGNLNFYGKQSQLQCHFTCHDWARAPPCSTTTCLVRLDRRPFLEAALVRCAVHAHANEIVSFDQPIPCLSGNAWIFSKADCLLRNL